jgi:hypothetical protein
MLIKWTTGSRVQTSCQIGCYIMTMTVRVQFIKKTTVVILKGLGTKTN